ncbi:MAG: type II secretion system protein [Synergistaceae bacterium]|nr:type II secretion system protein [Synergistaceae bacterium]
MRHKGFSLVELLIVMAIIAILSSMFFMSAAESRRSAEVTNLYNNMRNLSVAALAYYADNAGKNFGEGATDGDIIDDVKGYMQNWSSVPNPAYYHVVIDNNKAWWAVYYIKDDTANFKAKMQGRAASLGLIGSSERKPGKLPALSTKPGYNNQSFVCLLIRKER